MSEESIPPMEITPSKDERTWAMLCHFSAFTGLIFPFGNFLAPLIIWLIKKDEMPFVEDQRAWRSVVFFDAGNVFNINRQQSDYTTGEDPSSVMDIDPSELRLSAGIAFTWITPIGPLSLSYANPFNYSDSDELEKFQFSIGQVF